MNSYPVAPNTVIVSNTVYDATLFEGNYSDEQIESAAGGPLYGTNTSTSVTGTTGC